MLLELIPLEFHFGDHNYYPLKCIIAEVVDQTHLHVLPFYDGSITLPSYHTKTTPAICDACRWILKTAGYHAGTNTYLGRKYPLCIQDGGGKEIFHVQSVYYGSKNFQYPPYSDAEVNIGKDFTGQLL